LAEEKRNPSISAQKSSSEAKNIRYYDKTLKKVLVEVNPISPPAEATGKIRLIAAQFNLPDSELSQLIDDFLHHYNIDPNAPPGAFMRSLERDNESLWRAPSRQKKAASSSLNKKTSPAAKRE